MLAIADVLAKSDYDFVTLQEVWSLSDYTLIADKVKKTLPHSHYYYRYTIIKMLQVRTVIMCCF